MKNNLYTIILISILGTACGENLDYWHIYEEPPSDLIPLREDLRSGPLREDLRSGRLDPDILRQAAALEQYCEYIANFYNIDRVLTRWECRCYQGIGDDTFGPEAIERTGEEGRCAEADRLWYCDADGWTWVVDCPEMNLTCGMNDDLGVYDCI